MSATCLRDRRLPLLCRGEFFERHRFERLEVEFASAQDLRRSFGERWAPRVMPQVLMELMRHESIETTLKYYVGRNAQNTAAALYAALGNTLGNTPEKTQIEDAQENAESLYR